MAKRRLRPWTSGCVLGVVVLAGAASRPSAAASGPDFTQEQRQFWSLQKVAAVSPPAVRQRRWVRTPIDAFILDRLEAKRLAPASPADRITLLRRAYFDLIGLPPSPDAVAAFVADESPDAFAKVVDRLLASPQYGERWGRHWLDLARYAESEGFKADETRPNAWRYRDYVIDAFNSDKPYDRFAREQLAGDELWPGDPAARIATAFNRHYPDESNARNLLQRRQEILDDVTDTVGAVFLGLTYGCARCHNHKFDPILQKDYYRLQAFVANMRADDEIPLASSHEIETRRARLAVWEEKTRAIRERIEALEAPKRAELVEDFVTKYPPEVQAALAKSPSERTPIEWQLYYKAKAYIDPSSHEFVASSRAIGGALKGEAKKAWQAAKAELEAFADLYPADLPVGTGIVDAGPEAPPTHTLRLGVYDRKVEKVEPGFLSILAPEPAVIVPPAGLRSTGRRTALANWIASADNPLTARVMVNRIWHYHFGRGLVATPSNFGAAGERPSHPELLDWLAGEFVRQGWSVKAMHRLIMNSSVYQQASTAQPPAALDADPQNALLWRYPRHRLEGEAIRDAALAAAGDLNLTVGGPSVFPELPPGMASRGGWKTSAGADRNRRSVYVFVRRNTRYPMFEAFDMPDTHESCPRRDETTSPIQALTLLNSAPAMEWAEGLAARVLENAGANREAQIAVAYRLAYSRPPKPEEAKTAYDFLQRQRAIVAGRAAAGGKVAAVRALPASVDRIDAAALVDFCHMLINSNEFVYIN